MKAPPQSRPSYRLIGYCTLTGAVGGLVALGMEKLVALTQQVFLVGIGGFTPPEPGVLAQTLKLPSGWARLWIPVATTLGGLISGYLVFRFAPETEGHGTDAAIEAYHQTGATVRGRVPLVKAVTSALTIGSGGVAGKEGPAAQISAGFGALLASALRLRGHERRILMLASMAAGLAAIFQAPLGMAIFTVEVLYSGMAFESEALIYTVVSAVTAYAVFGISAGWKPIFAIPEGMVFTPAELPAFALLGLLAGGVALLLPGLLYEAQSVFRRIPGPPHIKPAIGGLCVGLIAMVVPGILGGGYGWIELAMAGKLSLLTVVAILVVKGPGMALTIGSGGSGGVFAPTVTIGGLLGAAVGLLLADMPSVAAPTAAFVIVGMAAVFAGAARTPLSTLIMVAEMTGGYGLIVPAMLANVISFLVQRGLSGHMRWPTLYQAQVENREASPLHRGVFVRRALELLEDDELDAGDIRLPRLVSLLRFGEPIAVAGAEGMLAAVEIEEGSELAERTVSDSLGSRSDMVAVALLRGEGMEVPRGATMIRAGDQLLVVAGSEALETLRRDARSGAAAG